jgi:hypothetical protein
MADYTINKLILKYVQMMPNSDVSMDSCNYHRNYSYDFINFYQLCAALLQRWICVIQMGEWRMFPIIISPQ